MPFCPSCGHPSLQRLDDKELRCPCGFHYFQNVAAAVMVALCWQDRVLVAVRGREPGKGLWDLPGGFVDPDESLEQALLRELDEETGWRPRGILPRYLGPFPNTYPYDGIVYKTCDTLFALSLPEPPPVQAADDVAELRWVTRAELVPERFAFESTRRGIALLLSRIESD